MLEVVVVNCEKNIDLQSQKITLQSQCWDVNRQIFSLPTLDTLKFDLVLIVVFLIVHRIFSVTPCLE